MKVDCNRVVLFRGHLAWSRVYPLKRSSTVINYHLIGSYKLMDSWVNTRKSSLDEEVTGESFSPASHAPSLSQLITVY